MDVHLGEPSPPAAPETPPPKQNYVRCCKKKVSDPAPLHVDDTKNSTNAASSYRHCGMNNFKSFYLRDIDVNKMESEDAVRVNSPRYLPRSSGLAESKREQILHAADDSDPERNVPPQSCLHGAFLEDEKENIPVGVTLASPLNYLKVKDN